MKKWPFDIGDEVCLDMAGPGSVTVELLSTAERISVSGGIDPIAKAPKERLQ